MNMKIQADITQRLRTLKAQVPGGFAMAFHVRFATPTFLLQTYPKTWADYYSQKGLVMSDPTVAWGFANTGTCRWSALDLPDPDDVIAQAASYGLKFGVVIAVEIDGSRSFASFADAEREFSDDEIAAFHSHIKSLHATTAKLNELPPDVTNNLRKMAVTVNSAAG